MANTTYTDNVTVITADTMNDLNRLHYTIFNDPADVTAASNALLNSAGDVGVGGVAVGGTKATIYGNLQTQITTNTGVAMTAYNGSAGGSAYAQVAAQTTAGSVVMQIGGAASSQALLYTNSAQGLNIYTSVAQPIILGINGTEGFRLNSTRDVVFNTNTTAPSLRH
jgi:hypothetical protein